RSHLSASLVGGGRSSRNVGPPGTGSRTGGAWEESFVPPSRRRSRVFLSARSHPRMGGSFRTDSGRARIARGGGVVASRAGIAPSRREHRAWHQSEAARKRLR